MKTLRTTAAEDLLDIIMRRHERLPTIITTNRPTQDWAQFLGDVPAATAILDRFLQHVEIILMQGKSYRIEMRRAALSPDGTLDASTPDPVPQAPTPPPPTDGRKPRRK
jgi:DNA replication protein DnaC